jgi:hypothetical protein
LTFIPAFRDGRGDPLRRSRRHWTKADREPHEPMGFHVAIAALLQIEPSDDWHDNLRRSPFRTQMPLSVALKI